MRCLNIFWNVFRYILEFCSTENHNTNPSWDVSGSDVAVCVCWVPQLVRQEASARVYFAVKQLSSVAVAGELHWLWRVESGFWVV
jgi:hypothetical protein